MKIPFVSFSDLHQPIKQEMLAAFEKFYDSNWYILGKDTESFEKAYASFNHTEFCVGTSNGLDALHIALKTLGIGPGDEVIMPANTYIATLLAVSYVGATPVLVEPDELTYNISHQNILKAITPNTKVIMPVHLYGQACEMDEIMAIAKTHSLFVIEDNAQSQGASFNGKLTGSFGDINATSFYPGKNLGALGDAGAVTTNNTEYAEKAQSLRNYGSLKKYQNDIIGYNMRLDECQASLLCVKLNYLESWTHQRQEIAEWYKEQLLDTDKIILPKTHKNATHVYHLFVIRTEQRDKLQEYLNKNGIGSLIHYPIPPHLQKAYVSLGFKKGDFPITEKIANTCLSLPIWPGMTKDMVTFVCNTIKNFSFEC